MCEQEIIVAFRYRFGDLPHLWLRRFASIIANNKTDCSGFLIIHDGIIRRDQARQKPCPNQNIPIGCQIR